MSKDATHPARSIQNFPKDGGFGRELTAAGTFGNQTFNLTSVVEAADTPPFFHSNLSDTLERVVDFYTGPEFNNPRAPAARFNFDQTQRAQLANFMRALNTLQNIDVASRELKEIFDNNRNNPRRETDNRLQTAFEETQDSIDVLNEGMIFADAVTQLTSARNLIVEAQHSNDTSHRRSLVQQAIVKLRSATVASLS